MTWDVGAEDRGADRVIEAAYFDLLRAREHEADLQRYQQWLAAEARRLRRSISEADALATEIHPQLRRRLAHTDHALAEAARLRLDAIAEEERDLPGRLAAAAEHVATCEAEHDRLRQQP